MSQEPSHDVTTPWQGPVTFATSPQPGAGEDERARTYLKHVRSVLARRWRLIAAVTLLGGAAAGYVISGLTPLYASSAELVVQQAKQASVGLAALTGGLQQDFYTNETEASVLRSLDLANRVVNELRLDQNPWFNPAKRAPQGVTAWLTALRGDSGNKSDVEAPWPPPTLPGENAILTAYFDHLTVQASDRSRVITLKFVAPNPELAASVVNKLIEVYQRQQIDLRKKAQGRETAWLSDQSNELREKVIAAQRKLEQFRAVQGLGAAGDIETLNRQLNDYNTQLLSARIKRVEAEAKAQQVSAIAVGNESGLDNVPLIAESPIVQRLREQQIQSLRKLGELRQRYRPEHPDVLAAQSELDQIAGPLKVETAKVVAGLNVAARLARVQEVAIEAQLRDLRAEIATHAESEAALRTLEVELKTNNQLFETLLARLKEASAIDEQIQQSDARVISAASPPDRPFYPNKPLLASVAFAASALIGIALAFALDFLDSSFRTPRQIEEATGLHVAGMVLRAPKRANARARPTALIDKHVHARFAETLRSLRVMLSLRHTPRTPMVLLVTSAVPGEGKTFTSVTLATSYSGAGSRVVVVDCDLRSPAVARYFKGKSDNDLTSYLAGAGPAEDCLASDKETGVDFVAARPADERLDPPLLLGSARMDALIERLKLHFDVIILDTPPVSLFSDALVLQRHADRTLFCVHWGKTPREFALNALKSLVQVDPRLISVALTQVDPRRQDQFDYDAPGAARFASYYARHMAAQRERIDGLPRL